MKAIPSIRARLSRSLVAISCIWCLALLAAVWTVTRHEVDELLDNALQESAEILYGLISFNIQQLPIHAGGPAGGPMSMQAPAHTEHLIWQIVDHRNVTLLRSHTAPDMPLLSASTHGFADVGERWRVFGMPLSGENELMLYVAQPSSERRETGQEIASYAGGVALFISLACILWIRRRVRQEFEPVTHLSEAVHGFDPLSSTSELPPAERLELEPIHQAISNLSHRLAQRIANERAFSAHAAHALRTPLAGIDAQLAVAMRESPDGLLPRLKQARTAAKRLQQVVTALLALFRSGSEARRESLSMRDLIAHIPVDGLVVSTEGVDRIDADPDLLAAALMNLLDNSARYFASCVRISVQNDHGLVVILQDNGSGIAEEKRVQLQEAIDAQVYSERTGLGLMLADVVARAHGGCLRLASVSQGQGCVVELHLAGQEKRLTALKRLRETT